MIAVAHIAEALRARLFLQFPIAIGGTGQAIKGMVGDTQLHDTAPQLLQPLGLGAHHHAIGNGRGAGGGIPTRPSISTRHRRQEPKLSTLSVAQSLGTPIPCA